MFVCFNVYIIMSTQILEKLFDSPVKVKLFKLFLRNIEMSFSLDDIVSRTQIIVRLVKKEMSKLESIGFIVSKKVSVKYGLKKKRVKKVLVYGVNPNFVFYPELKSLILKSNPASEEKIKNDIIKIGKVKLAVLSGVFSNNDIARVDLLLVGNGIDQNKSKKFLKRLEAEVGKEIRYVILTIDEFNYRVDMFDRFLRDILECPHKKIINKLKI